MRRSIEVTTSQLERAKEAAWESECLLAGTGFSCRHWSQRQLENLRCRARSRASWRPRLSPVDKSSGDIQKQQDTHHESHEAHDEKDQFHFAQRKQPAHQSETFALIGQLGKRERPVVRGMEGRPLSSRVVARVRGSSSTLSRAGTQRNRDVGAIAYLA